MRSDSGKERAFWTRDLLTAAMVIAYLVIAGGAVEAWNFISQKADAFAATHQSDHQR